MDGKRFDNLTKTLGAGASRRSVLKALLGGAGAVAASAVVKNGTEATHCNPSVSQQTPCPDNPGGLPPPAMGGLEGACCNGHGNCCSLNCIDFGGSHEGACGPTASEGTTTTPAPGTTTPDPTVTTPDPTATTPAPTATTAAPGATTAAPAAVSAVPSAGVGDGSGGSAGVLGMTLAGGAAALFAAKVLRRRPDEEAQDA